MQNPNQPRPFDAVLGRPPTAPVGAVVLGGLDGIRQRLASPLEEQRLAVLSELANHGESGLDLWIQALGDRSLRVQKTAYLLLRSRLPAIAEAALETYDPYPIFDCLYTLTGHAGGITAVAISPDGHLAASAGRDAVLRIWDLTYREERAAILVPSFIYALQIHADNRTLTAKGQHQTLKAWDLHTEAEIDPEDLRTRAIASVTLSANQHRTHKHLISGSQNTVRIWDLQRGKEVNVLRGHQSLVTSVAASQTPLRIISGSEDRTLKVWGVDEGISE